MMKPILQVKNLKKVYGKKTPFLAVDEISFSLKAGEILGLVGPNGSGKTTTIQMLLGTLSYSSGSILYFGKELRSNRSEVLKSIAFASTYTSLPYILTIEENLEVFGRFYGLSPKETLRRTGPLMERFGIIDKRNARVSSLSAGQITRLMLVKAFFTDPKIVLLDEPTASLDPDVALEICRFLASERDRTGLSILFTSHKMDEVAELCDRAIFLKQGKIIADDSPKNLARSVSSHRVHLVILEGMNQAVALLDKNKLNYKIEQNSIEISIEDKKIPLLLGDLARDGITYSAIRIEEPSLENYFLQIAEKK